eukprot:277978-Rhodomonas_salina.1
MRVSFNSDESQVALGFAATWAAGLAATNPDDEVPQPEEKHCTGSQTFTDPSGTLEDGSGTADYGNNVSGGGREGRERRVEWLGRQSRSEVRSRGRQAGRQAGSWDREAWGGVLLLFLPALLVFLTATSSVIDRRSAGVQVDCEWIIAPAGAPG